MPKTPPSASPFWQHYAQANDDIRTKLIDEAWFQSKTGGSKAFQEDVQAMAERERRAPRPEPDPMREFYGRPPAPARTQEVYGADPETTAEGPDIHGNQTVASNPRSLYGYDALDAPEPDIHGNKAETDIEPDR
jgi:hypothetical protein